MILLRPSPRKLEESGVPAVLCESADDGVWLEQREKDMLKERRTRVLRRIAVGLAVAAFVAPAAQAHVYELGGGTQDGNGVAVINGDDKVLAQDMGDYGLADYRRALPTDHPTRVLVGSHQIVPPGQGDYGLADYRRALPTDYPSAVLVGDDKTFAPDTGDATVLVHGDDKVIAPDHGNYGLADYRHATPQDYGDRIAVPVGDVSSPSTFDWGDALIGAGIAFALMLLAGTAVLGTRRRARPAAA
jgi:hypothetical protein